MENGFIVLLTRRKTIIVYFINFPHDIRFHVWFCGKLLSILLHHRKSQLITYGKVILLMDALEFRVDFSGVGDP